jgi:hypothetical protein
VKEQEKQLGAWKNALKWKKKGFEFLLLASNREDRFHGLQETVKGIKASRKAHMKLKGGAAAVRAAIGFSAFGAGKGTRGGGGRKSINEGMDAAKGGATPKAPQGSPTKPPGGTGSLSNGRRQRLNSSGNISEKSEKSNKSRGRGKEEEEEEEEEEQEMSLILDSTAELHLTKELKTWCEDALETDSLKAFELEKIWKLVSVMVTRQEEEDVANELEKIEVEVALVGKLVDELTRIYGKEEDEWDNKRAEERWAENPGSMDLPEVGPKGQIVRNNYSLALLQLNKEKTVLKRKLEPKVAGGQRRSTIGFVNQMMFTKRVGAVWKKSVLGSGGGGGPQTTEKVIEGLLKRKQALEFEIAMLESQEKDRVLTRQQMEIKALQEGNLDLKNKLMKELGMESLEAGEQDNKKSMYVEGEGGGVGGLGGRHEPSTRASELHLTRCSWHAGSRS